MTDCQSLHDYINNPVPAGTEDKRLEIDLEGLREYIWEHTDGSLKDYITEDQNDKIQWIDTSTMICDSLTKAGPAGFANRLIKCMQSSYLDLEPTAESTLKKMKQQKMRMEKALAKADLQGEGVNARPKTKAKAKSKANAKKTVGTEVDLDSATIVPEDPTSEECDDPD